MGDITRKIITKRIKGLATSWFEEKYISLFSCNKENNDNKGSNLEQETIREIPLFLKPTKEFLVPGNLKVPMILVGPGTGLAPFMGFLEHRQLKLRELSDRNKNLYKGYWRGGFALDEDEFLEEEDEDCIYTFPGKSELDE